MDLVDIDKVLDSLEQNDETKDEFTITKPAGSNSMQLRTEDISKSTLDVVAESVKTILNSSSDKVNKFIGVSNLFSSLDDYCKHVESLNIIADVTQVSRNSDKFDDLGTDLKATGHRFDDGIDVQHFVDAAEDREHELSPTPIISSPSSFSSGLSPALLSIESSIENPSIDGNSLNTTLNCGSESESLASDLSSISFVKPDRIMPICLVSKASESVCSEQIQISDQLDQSLNLVGDADGSKKTQNRSSKTQPPLQKSIIFASTVDEISDTELDSILQEIEPEISHNELIHKDLVHSNHFASEVLKSPEHEANFDKKANEEASIVNNSVLSYNQHIEKGKMNVDEIDVNAKQTSPKKQRPTSLNLPVRIVNLYATAGQTPPGLGIYDHTTSSSEENTPEVKMEVVCNVENSSLSDAGGHTSNHDLPSLVESNSVNTEHNQYTESVGSVVDQYEKIPGENSQVSNSPVNSNNLCPNIGKVPPIWVPDNEAASCMQCDQKFSLLRRRHHCRACGQVLCSVCCSQKFKLEFLSNSESRVCIKCFLILTRVQEQQTDKSIDAVLPTSTTATRMPNPNNPMEYCSTIPPHRQVNTDIVSYPTVIVPVGVLKKETNLKMTQKRKSVIFSDGIRPGSDLVNLDGRLDDTKSSHTTASLSNHKKENGDNTSSVEKALKCYTKKSSFGNSNDLIPVGEQTLPPVCVSHTSVNVFQEIINNADLVKRLHSETLKFALHINLYVFVKIVHLKCCINKTVINFTTCGLHHVGNDEILILLELDNTNVLPKDIFVHLNQIYREASKGHPTTELGFSMPNEYPFLGSRQHGGFLFIRSTFQCLKGIHVPNSPFLIGLLIHRWEVPWAKILPLRLKLRLGAQYQYYPSPHISVRKREPVYAEISQTIINLLADFRNFTYTLPTIRGMYIHMEDNQTNILIPRNRHDEVMSAIKNSSDHILAMGANFSKKADGHLVCIQNINSEGTDLNSYSTQAINIQGQPRKVTGASFFILNEALKSTSGLSSRCSIIEDGLMVQLLPSKMADVKDALMNMKDIDINCGPAEMVSIQWVDKDAEINIGIRSPIDFKHMDGIPSIRVHSGVHITNNSHTLKWTEVFLLETSGTRVLGQYSTIDISKISEVIAKATTIALHPFLDLLAANGYKKIGLRVTLNPDRVCYEAGSQNEKLPPLYMDALDLELIPVLHRKAIEIRKTIVLELIFYILNA